MKKRQLFKILLGLFLLPALPCQAQLLWKITGDNLKHPSYLFGTHHTTSIEFTEQIHGFKKAFNSCKQMYGEIVLGDQEARAATQIKMMLAMQLPKDTTLKELFTDEEYVLIDEHTKKYLGIGIDRFKTMKPAAINLLIAAQLSTKIIDQFDPNMVIDLVLQERALKKKKKVFGLETDDYQVQLLSKSSLQEQAKELLETLQTEDLAEQSQKLYNLYIQQDIDGIHTYMNKEIELSNATAQDFLFDRNHSWAEQLKEILPQKATFIAVGAAHLPGEDGLIALLRKMGYTVEPVQ